MSEDDLTIRSARNGTTSDRRKEGSENAMLSSATKMIEQTQEFHASQESISKDVDSWTHSP